MNLFDSNYQNWTNTDKEKYFAKRVIKYLPTFVRLLSFALIIIIKACSKSFIRVYDYAHDFRNRYYAGKSLRFHAERKRITHLEDETETVIRERIAGHKTILNNRGTESGIVSDLQNIENISNAIPELYGAEDNTGWILDVNYPEIFLPKINFLDTYKVLKLNLQLQHSLGYALIDEARLGFHINDEIKTMPDDRSHVDNEITPIDVITIYE